MGIETPKQKQKKQIEADNKQRERIRKRVASSKDSEGIVRSLYNKIPTNVRLLVENLTGVDRPITAADFTEDELVEMVFLAEKTKQANKKREDVLQGVLSNEAYLARTYEDYTPDTETKEQIQKILSSFKKTRDKTSVNPYNTISVDKGFLDSAYSSFTDPRYVVATSLGKYNAFDVDNKIAKIRDTYNFNAKERNVPTDFKNVLERSLASPELAGEYLANYLGTKDRDVNIDLPLQMSAGGMIDSNKKLNLAEGGMATYLTRSDEITPEQYQESPIDFYNMPKIEAEVIDTDDDDDEDEKPPVVANVLTPVTTSGDETPQTNIFTQTTFSGRPAYDIKTIDYNDFIKNFDQMDDVKTQKGIDRVKSGFSDFLSQTISDPGKLIGSTAFSAMGNPVMAPVMHFAGSLNRKQQLDTARAMQRSATPFEGNKQIASQASFAGNMMSVNGQVVHRSPGKRSYNGTLPDIPDAGRTLYRQEEITKGYIPGTMFETESDGPDGNPSGSFVTSGKYGLLDEATAKKIGGNYDAYGNFHTAYGSAGGGTMKAAKALAAQYGVPESSVGAMIKAINNGTYSKGFFGTTRSVKAADYSNDRMIAVDIIKSFSTKAVQRREADEQKQQDVMDAAQQRSRDEIDRLKSTSELQRLANEIIDRGDSDHDSGGGGGTISDFDTGLSHALGGRVGYAPGGPVQQGSPAGFVERPPSQVSEAATVADDKPMSVSEGTFVINAAAVEFAGEEDIADMLKKAYVKAGKKDMGGPSTQEIDIAVSRGEVIVPAHIAKIIGYDRLEKINNRGKAETSKRIEENGQQPAGAAGGGFLTRKKLANGGEADDYEDKIVIDEVRRKMDVLMDEVAARDDPVEVLSNYFESGSAQKEYDDAQAEKNQRVPIGGTFYKATAGEYNRVSVPKTPTLFNLFVMAEEVAHLDSLKPGNPKTRKNPYSKPEYDLLKDFNNVTGGLFSGTRVMGQDYDAHKTFNKESKYLEEMRAKQIAFQTVFGGLAERQVKNTKAGKTIKYTKASYQKMFADYISAFASPVVKAAFFEKYPDLKSVYRETPVDDQLKEQSDTESTRERILLGKELQKKVKKNSNTK